MKTHKVKLEVEVSLPKGLTPHTEPMAYKQIAKWLKRTIELEEIIDLYLAARPEADPVSSYCKIKKVKVL